MPRARRNASRLASVVAAGAVICAAAGASAKDEPDPVVMDLMQPEGADPQDYLALEQALDAHMRPLAVEVRLQPVSEIPESPRDQEDQAREALSRGGRAVVWIDPKRRLVVLIHVDDEGRESRLERQVDCIAGHLGRCADAIASVVSSAVSSWEESAPAEAGEQDQPAVEYAVDNELSPLELSHPPWTRPDPLVRLSGGLGYGGVLFDGSSPGAHGFDLGLWIQITRYVMAEATLDFYWAIEGRSADIAGWVEIGRTDVAGRVGGALPIGRFVLTLTAGAVFDFAEVEGASEGVDVDGSGETRKGFSALLSARVRLVEWFSIWVGAGVDALDSDLVYRGTDAEGDREVLVRCGAVQARLQTGIEIGIGLGTMPEG